MELDLGLSHGPSGGRFAQEGLVKPTDVVSRARPSRSRFPGSAPQHDPFLEVVAEEAVADRPCSCIGASPGIPFADDPRAQSLGWTIST